MSRSEPTAQAAEGGEPRAQQSKRQGGRGADAKRKKAPEASASGCKRGTSSETSVRKPKSTLTSPVFFVGFMGAGKTSVARYIARVCGIASVDADTYLERRENRKIKDIFAEEGEEFFRDLETSVLDELSRKDDPLLISCGGGIVTREENRRILADAGTVVYLKVTADEAASRISNKSSRPLFSDIEAARELCEKRAGSYECVADIVVDTKDKSVRSIAYEVQRQLERKGVLCRQHGS